VPSSAAGRRFFFRLGGPLVGAFVVAGVAAGFAVQEAVLADPDIELRLAQAAVLIALALVFRHFALGATEFAVAGSGGHISNLALRGVAGNVPLVTEDELLIETLSTDRELLARFRSISRQACRLRAI